MSRLFAFAAVVATSLTLLSATPGSAQSAGYYSATPTAAPSKASVITAGTLWRCQDGVCSAKESTQRDIIMCQMVVQRVGALSQFSVKGAAFDAATLAKCNERAK